MIDVDDPLCAQLYQVDLLCSVSDGKVGHLLESTHLLLELWRD